MRDPVIIEAIGIAVLIIVPIYALAFRFICPKLRRADDDRFDIISNWSVVAYGAWAVINVPNFLSMLLAIHWAGASDSGLFMQTVIAIFGISSIPVAVIFFLLLLFGILSLYQDSTKKEV